jgi:hypothetical protein
VLLADTILANARSLSRTWWWPDSLCPTMQLVTFSAVPDGAAFTGSSMTSPWRMGMRIEGSSGWVDDAATLIRGSHAARFRFPLIMAGMDGMTASATARKPMS